MILILFFLTYVLNVFGSVQIGLVRYSSVRTNTSFIATSDPKCSDCLCNCLTNDKQVNSTVPKCHGINCFPFNRSCQRIEQSWIQETDILVDNTSDQFIITNDINFCSVYSAQNILNRFQNVTPISIPHTNARYVIYNPYDDTLIVLGNNLIARYYASNLTRFQNLSTTVTPLAVAFDAKNIYISFGSNMSVNKYDMNMTFIISVRKPIISSTTRFYGIVLWKNSLLVTDDQLSLIWSLDLNTMNMSVYLNLTTYNISPFNIAIFNDCLYISQLSSSIIYMFSLLSASMQTITFANTIALYRLEMDPFCNRLWFGLDAGTYTSVPVVNLNMNTVYAYQAKGLLAQSKVYKVAFDFNYSMYTVATGDNFFYKYQMTPMI